MNIDTNELVTAAEMARMSADERSRFQPLPDHLSKAAHKGTGPQSACVRTTQQQKPRSEVGGREAAHPPADAARESQGEPVTSTVYVLTLYEEVRA